MAYLKNPNCCGDMCISPDGEVRVLPIGGGGNLILCHTCYTIEMTYRRSRNAQMRTPIFQLPKWDTLKVYEV